MSLLSLTDDQLMKQPLKALALHWQETEWRPVVEGVLKELAEKSVPLAPVIYVGDEWFSPEGICAVAVPFYLLHPRLRAIEKSLMLDVEGEKIDDFRRLLRHELGHAFDHAYGLSKRSSWRKIFGSPNIEYDPDNYRPKPYSRSFVRNLPRWYAQAHPDEDFAETFAVWLDPHSDWKKMYARWPQALAKLEYVDDTIKKLASKAKKNTSNQLQKVAQKASLDRLPYDARYSKLTLARYYERRKKERNHDYPEFFDEDLKQIFVFDHNFSTAARGASDPSLNQPNQPEKNSSANSAGSYLLKNRRFMTEVISHWTGERKYTVNELIKTLAHRCDALHLKMGESSQWEVICYLTAMVGRYLFTGKFKRNV